MAKLLQETGDILLLETGDNLLLSEEAGGIGNTLLIDAVFLHVNKDLQKVPVTLVDAGGNLLEGVTSPSGLQISKNGAAYASPSLGTWTEISDGDYTVTLDETDTDTVGFLLLRVVEAGESRETKVYCEVSIDPAERAVMAENVRRIRQERLK